MADAQAEHNRYVEENRLSEEGEEVEREGEGRSSPRGSEKMEDNDAENTEGFTGLEELEEGVEFKVSRKLASWVLKSRWL